MQVAVAGTGARPVDGSTNVLPVGPRDDVHAAWRLHAGLVRRALERGRYQGWGLHPAQLVPRYTATYAFFRAALPAAAARLAAYLDRSASGVLDEPATARALATVVLRALDCGAVDDAEVRAAGGPERPDLDRLAGRRPGDSGVAADLSSTATTIRGPRPDQRGPMSSVHVSGLPVTAGPTEAELEFDRQVDALTLAGLPAHLDLSDTCFRAFLEPLRDVLPAPA